MNWIDRLKNVFGSTSGKLPNFLCIGAQRAGTSWLHEILRRHPDIFLSATKELHFFDEKRDFSTYTGIGHIGERFLYDMNSLSHWRWYVRQFRKSGGRKIIGEITPYYSTLSDQRIAYIAEKLPDVKIVYILRNPVQRAWSAFRRTWFLETGHTNDDFDTNVALKTIMYPAKLIHGDYIRNTGVYEKIFGKDQILYLFYDDIVRKPSGVLHQVFSFLGVAIPQIPADDVYKKINSAPGHVIPGPVEKVLSDYYADQISFLKKRFDRELEY